jgi:DNA-binding NarL/FixJ family response regulator
MQILLIDDHALFRSGLKFLLSDLDEGLVFAEAATLKEAELRNHQQFDLILLDWNLPGHRGESTLARVRELFTEATVVILSGEEDPALVRKAVDLGASGFIPKSSLPIVMVSALRLVLAGGIYLPAELLFQSQAPRQAAQNLGIDAPVFNPLSFLSERQKQALMLAVKGKSNKEISRELEVSEGTVKQHLSTAFRLLNVSNRTEAVYAVAELERNSNQQKNFEPERTERMSTLAK